MCAAGSDWSLIIAVTGMATTLVGTLLGVYLSNLFAERRQQRRQLDEDRTRFHRDRLEIYTRFLKASQLVREAAYPLAPQFLRNAGQPASADNVTERLRRLGRYMDARTELIEARQMVALLALPKSAVNRTAQEVFDAADQFLTDGMTAEELSRRNEELAAKERAFLEAAREELLPKGTGDGEGELRTPPS
jgi:hypothetical protein